MPLNNCPILCTCTKLASTDAVKTLVAGVAGKKIRLVSVGWVWLTAAAQVVEMKEQTAGTTFFAFPASYAAGATGELQFETELGAGNGFQADPVAAGPEAYFTVRYQLVD